MKRRLMQIALLINVTLLLLIYPSCTKITYITNVTDTLYAVKIDTAYITKTDTFYKTKTDTNYITKRDTVYIANASTTATTILGNNYIDMPVKMKHLCIYYAYPSLVNGSNYDVAKATKQFMPFDVIVFGGSLENTANGDHNNTKQIITTLKQDVSKIIYGYIDVGIRNMITNKPLSNYTEQQLKQKIDLWKQMGVTGVFADDFGSGDSVFRSRQNTFIDYAHANGLSVFANYGDIDEVLGGTDCHLGSSDYYLLESFLVGYTGYTSLAYGIVKAQKALDYKRNKKVHIASVSSLPFDSLSANFYNTDYFKLTWYASAMFNFDAFQFTDNNYSIPTVLYNYPNLATNYGTSWTPNNGLIKTPTGYERFTNTNTFYIKGDGVKFGKGGMY